MTGGREVSIFWNQPASRAQGLQIARNEDRDMHGGAIYTFRAPSDKEAAVKSEKEPLNSQRNSLVAMIENFVETFKSVPAKDSMEKGEILEQIDQKIREGMRIETDLNKALHFVGTCPDMCPEKERYFREHRQRLATYEMLSGRAEVPETRGGQYFFVDPSKAVKEYSRSSADQEKPLPHELRPEHVLQLTMNYLMLSVMNADDKNWADRYDFIWNRTRGIRKDITQQHLCNENSVDLIEKCTRFHIVCSHHLCEEDINVFDPKINNEHLTKCLQSLKHMYEDLYFKKSITCPNEAEFRCYQILLNLNNGDILREITEFRLEIRESKEVKFALEVLRALNSTNYVRFFKLLHSGSYLMACIMQRYFNQIRSTGLCIMNKAYTSTGTRPVPIPLSDIARLFAIDELDEATEFCSHYGFQVDNGMVYFSKSSFEEPESKFLPVRNGVIDKKRTSSFGEVVNGKPLPVEFDYVPTNSFDANGCYNGNYHTLALKGILRDTDTSINKIVTMSGDKLLSYPMRVGKDDIKAMCSAIIIPVVQKEVVKICTEAVEDARSELVAMNEVADCVVTSVVKTEVQACLETEIREGMFEKLSLDLYDGISRCVIEEQARKIIFEEFEAERLRRDQERRMQQFHLAAQISRDFLHESIQSNTKDILHEVIRQEKHEMEMILLRQHCTILSREYLESFLVKEIREICTASKELEVKWREEKLEQIKMKMLISRKRKIFKKWVKERETRLRIRDTLHNFPPCSPLQSSEVIPFLTHRLDHASQLPSYISLKNNVELTVSSVSNTAKRRDDHRNAIELYHQRIVSVRQNYKTPLDFRGILQFMAQSMKAKSQSCIYSKLFLCFPVTKETSSVGVCDIEVVKEKFKDSQSKIRQEESTMIEDFCGLSAPMPHGIISLSIKGMPDSISKTEAIKIEKSKELYGASGFIFVAEMHKINWSIYYQKVKDILALKPKMPPCPILFIGLNGSFSKGQIKEYLELEKLKEAGDVSWYEILLIESDTGAAELHQQLFASLLNLISKTPQQPKLQCSSFANLLEEALQLNFFESIYNARISQKDIECPVLNPQSVVELYNAALDHVVEICTSEKLSQLSWPSVQMLQRDKKNFPDLVWNGKENFNKLECIINSLHLPRFDFEVQSDGDWDAQVEYCLEYLHRILQNSEFNLHSSELISRVEVVVNKYLQKWKYRSAKTLIPFPWSLILEECVNLLLASTHRPQHHVEIPRMVCYFKKDFYKFKAPKSWVNEVNCIKRISVNSDALWSPATNNNSRNSSREAYIQQTLRELDDGFSSIENSLSRSHLDISNSYEALDDLLDKQQLLQESLSQERTEFSRMSDFCAVSVDRPVKVFCGTKRKRLPAEDLLEMKYKKDNLIDSMGGKREKDLESRIDDLFDEVKLLRSRIDLDEMRYHLTLDM